jgi:protein-disulfide isomerase
MRSKPLSHMAVPAVALAAAMLAGCRPSAAARSERSTSPVVARVAGKDITLAEVDFRAAGRLAQARQDEYEARVSAARALITEQLIAAEARKRNMSSEMYVENEVDEKVPDPSPKDLEGAYEANKARFAGQAKEKALATIAKLLKERWRSERDADFRRELLDQAGVKIDLVAPRQETNSLADAPSEGPAKARVTLVEFTDYQCPYCRRAEETVSTLLQDYKTKVRFVHADFPLSFHDRAMIAARASHCAGEQGKFFTYRHELLMDPGTLSDADLKSRAGTVGLDEKTFSSCLESDRHDAAIRAMADQGERFGVNATPTFFINGRKVTGMPKVEEFKRILDEEIAQAGG